MAVTTSPYTPGRRSAAGYRASARPSLLSTWLWPLSWDDGVPSGARTLNQRIDSRFPTVSPSAVTCHFTCRRRVFVAGDGRQHRVGSSSPTPLVGREVEASAADWVEAVGTRAAAAFAGAALFAFGGWRQRIERSTSSARQWSWRGSGFRAERLEVERRAEMVADGMEVKPPNRYVPIRDGGGAVSVPYRRVLERAAGRLPRCHRSAGRRCSRLQAVPSADRTRPHIPTVLSRDDLRAVDGA